MWNADQRGQAISIYSLAPLLGPTIGPIAGGWIADRSTWRWCFWSVTIADALVQAFGIFYLRESGYPSFDIVPLQD
jgi:MFS family permease